jgi:hypothetical protein
MASQGGEAYARKELDRIGVSSARELIRSLKAQRNYPEDLSDYNIAAVLLNDPQEMMLLKRLLRYDKERLLTRIENHANCIFAQRSLHQGILSASGDTDVTGE